MDLKYKASFFLPAFFVILGCASGAKMTITEASNSNVALLDGESAVRGGIEGGGSTGRGVATGMMASRTLSVSIACPPGKVYEFVSNPENIPKWAKGLGKSVRREGSGWIVESPQGPMKVRFAENNVYGVLDHYVTTPSGVEVYVPLRVLANGKGSEVIFTLFRFPDMTDGKFAEDSRMVEKDLRALKDLLES